MDAAGRVGDAGVIPAIIGHRSPWLHILGVDVADTAVSIARDGAAARGLDAEFIVGDAPNLGRLDRVFDTVLDCAVFHAFDNDERLDHRAIATATATSAPAPTAPTPTARLNGSYAPS